MALGGNPEQHNDAELTTTKRENGAHFLRDAGLCATAVLQKCGWFHRNIDRWSDFEYIALVRSSVGRGLPVGRDAKIGSRAARSRCASSTMPRLSENQYHYFFSAGLDGLDADRLAASSSTRTSWRRSEDKLFAESQQSGVERDPSRRLLLREHDRAVAYSRQAIHEMQADEVQREARNKFPLIFVALRRVVIMRLEHHTPTVV